MRTKAINLYWGVPLALLAVFAQAAVMPYIRLGGASPNLPLVLALCWVLLEGLGDGMVISLLAGLGVDGLSGGPFGLSMISMALTSAMAGVAEANVFRSARFLPYIMVCLASPLYDGVYLGLSALLRSEFLPAMLIWRIVLPGMLLNVLLMPLIYHPLKLLCARNQPRKAEWQ